MLLSLSLSLLQSLSVLLSLLLSLSGKEIVKKQEDSVSGSCSALQAEKLLPVSLQLGNSCAPGRTVSGLDLICVNNMYSRSCDHYFFTFLLLALAFLVPFCLYSLGGGGNGFLGPTYLILGSDLPETLIRQSILFCL